ncbi:MAG: hypothetical protein HY899_16885 [Deltaproteobacteria bacterium]|nr:hypothetical protein [Deltaproteobacteria bacterium]
MLRSQVLLVRAPVRALVLVSALVLATLAAPLRCQAAGDADGFPRIVPKIINVSHGAGLSGQPFGPPAPDRGMLLRELSSQVTGELWIEDFMDLERAYYEGVLVDVASDPQGLGVELRLIGASRIGELEDDPVRQSMLCRVSKPAAGLLYQFAQRLRAIEAGAYTPLVITSLVRPWQYQQRLAEVNPNADATRDGVPPTHVLGLAFDISRAGMSPGRQARIEALLGEFVRDGQVAFYKEGAGGEAYHVIALPSAREQLTAYWESFSGRGDRSQVATVHHVYAPDWPDSEDMKAELGPDGARARHDYAPVSPCVRFGAGLEPYSSICSCDMPLRPQPSIAVADGG